jgi:cytochrome c-type biogenesis protein
MSVGHLIMTGPLLFAVPVAAAAGAVTFLSPCVLPLVPGYLSYVTGMSGVDAQDDTADGDNGADAAAGPAGQQQNAVAGGQTTVAVTTVAAREPAASRRPSARRRAVLGTALFVLGFSAVYTSLGVAFGGFGGVLTIVLGLLFAGVLDRFPVTGRILRPSVRPRAGLAGAPMLGVLFGLSWTPCIGPTLTVVLSLSMTSGTAVRGAILTFAYCLGLGIPFLIVALAFERGVAAFGFARRHARAISLVGGAMLVAVGILEVTGAWSSALLWLKLHWIGSYQSPL